MRRFRPVCAAGMDLYASGYDGDIVRDTYVVRLGDICSIPTGIAVEIPDGYFGVVAFRSSMSFKRGFSIPSGIGVIDNDYRGEIRVAVQNCGNDPFLKIKAGERIAQLIILPMQYIQLKEVEELSDTERGTSGFGSTGV